MDFAWSEQQIEFRKALTQFGKKELSAGISERDEEGIFNRPGWEACARMGVHGMRIPDTYGGSAQDPLTTVGALEALGYGCKDNGLLFSINAHMWTAQAPLLEFGTNAQKERYLPRLASGEWIGGNAMTEPASGSDAYSLKTTARRKGDRYVLNGSKTFVTNAPVADVFVVFATVDPTMGKQGVTAFLVEKTFPGLQVSKPLKKMGLRTSPMAELFFDECEVPEENRLGQESAGSMLFTHSMIWERACILASAVGSMDRLLETCVRYAKQRKQFGQAIGKFQLVASKIVDMKLRLETCRCMLYRTAWELGRGRSAILEAAATKLHISESWVRSAEDAVQIHGGYGFMKEYEVERELRDAIGSRLYSGTSEIQRQIVGSLLGL